MQKILLGPAGSPARSTIEGLEAVKELSLQAMEVQFSHGIKMGNALAKQIGEENKKYKIHLSIHAPYYINLASTERAKVTASKKRILKSCELGHLMGAKEVVFHPGYYGKLSKKETYRIILAEMQDMQKTIRKNKWKTVLAPETTGKLSQFGDLDETLKLSRAVGCSLCLDSAHLYARNNGRINFDEVLGKLKRGHIHCHFSNINYSKKGELNHLVLDSKPRFADFAKAILKKKINCTIISESPITWKDSLKMKKTFEELGYRF